MIRTAKLLTIPSLRATICMPASLVHRITATSDLRSSSVWLTKTWQFTRIRRLATKYSTLVQRLNSSLDTFSVENLKTCICWDIFPHFEEEKGPRDVGNMTRERIRERQLLSRIHSYFGIRILAVWLLMYNGVGILEYASTRKLPDVLLNRR